MQQLSFWMTSQEMLIKGNLVGAVFVDLCKAFDTLSHATLLDKLPQYGIQGTELEWFKDYLFCRKQVVSYNGSDVYLQIITCLLEFHRARF
jgi:hypothetical protein